MGLHTEGYVSAASSSATIIIIIIKIIICIPGPSSQVAKQLGEAFDGVTVYRTLAAKES